MQEIEEIYPSVRVETIRAIEEAGEKASSSLQIAMTDASADASEIISTFDEALQSAHIQASMSLEPLTRKLEVFELGNRALAAVKRMQSERHRAIAADAIRGFLSVYESRIREESAHPEVWE